MEESGHGMGERRNDRHTSAAFISFLALAAAIRLEVFSFSAARAAFLALTCCSFGLTLTFSSGFFAAALPFFFGPNRASRLAW